MLSIISATFTALNTASAQTVKANHYHYIILALIHISNNAPVTKLHQGQSVNTQINIYTSGKSTTATDMIDRRYHHVA
jgi:hypothetical protein